jgi:hypothetical protein
MIMSLSVPLARCRDSDSPRRLPGQATAAHPAGRGRPHWQGRVARGAPRDGLRLRPAGRAGGRAAPPAAAAEAPGPARPVVAAHSGWPRQAGPRAGLPGRLGVGRAASHRAAAPALAL